MKSRSQKPGVRSQKDKAETILIDVTASALLFCGSSFLLAPDSWLLDSVE